MQEQDKTDYYSVNKYSTKQPLTWDIFCQVIDNYGDIGICWRLARQLAIERGFKVRLWVDDLNAFACICPAIQARTKTQTLSGIELRWWAADDDFSSITAQQIVIEAFGCALPERFIQNMADQQCTWINLEYLSAESWISDYHALPSPHPRLPITKYFFFPGFDEKSGGLLRERQLLARRDAFMACAEQQANFYAALKLSAIKLPTKLPTKQPLTLKAPPNQRTLRISLFAYANTALAQLLGIWQSSQTPVECFIPVTQSAENSPTLQTLNAFAGRHLTIGESIQCGNLVVHILPFLAQADYDQLLWLCDLNFVRGEDSFVRAQWAGKPMIWQIYPQAENAHLAKLDAFLSRYAARLSAQDRRAALQSIKTMHNAWNGQATLSANDWEGFVASLPNIQQHAENWAKKLAEQADLCSALDNFCRANTKTQLI